MELLTYIACALLPLASAAAAPPAEGKEPKGIVGKAIEDGFPVIYKFVDEEPAAAKRAKLPWLTVISWRYDGAESNGMPQKRVNERMVELEDALGENVVAEGFGDHVIIRTGANLKELIYYIRDQDQFMKRLNAAFKGHSAYPIEIKFYNDLKWTEFQKLRSDFEKKAGQKDAGSP